MFRVICPSLSRVAGADAGKSTTKQGNKVLWSIGVWDLGFGV